MSFLKRLIQNPEVKRGGAHLLVGVVIGLVTTLLSKGQAAD
jgi:hypothetical protein